ncbi:hypothetical protein SBA3_4610001 [Candidatus Sulfopaludibacter sp. SbA3]|nr:hypothetical protein SBA3_4610001 [Candidatus Sulfopaludibacter sp. SbA3]
MIETFLTAYDPSDLPGTSIDPLGFERGYLFLADKILPGLTNVASRPRYLALICAGIQLSGDATDPTRREQIRKRRQETILRLERFWALANVLARPDDSGAVRGVNPAENSGFQVPKCELAAPFGMGRQRRLGPPRCGV